MNWKIDLTNATTALGALTFRASWPDMKPNTANRKISIASTAMFLAVIVIWKVSHARTIATVTNADSMDSIVSHRDHLRSHETSTRKRNWKMGHVMRMSDFFLKKPSCSRSCPTPRFDEKLIKRLCLLASSILNWIGTGHTSVVDPSCRSASTSIYQSRRRGKLERSTHIRWPFPPLPIVLERSVKARLGSND